MTRIRAFGFVFTLCLLAAALTTRGFAENPHCFDVGGAILTNVGGFGEIDNSITTMGVATGDLKGAIGVQIVGGSADYTSIDVHHHWVTDNGETLDIGPATLQGAFVEQGLLAVKKYKAHLNGGTGRFTDATGDLSFIGEIDLNTGQVVLRYSGSVCTTAHN